MRQIYTTDAMQVVTSSEHPEGLLSRVSGFPKVVDSRTYGTTADPNGDTDVALSVAKADYHNAIKDLKTANNPNRTMWAVTITRADGVQIDKESRGAFPDMTPPEPEPEPEQE